MLKYNIMNKDNYLTEGKILGPLLKFAMPVLGALVLQCMYGAVDLIVVGKYGSAADIAAVATGAQIMNVLTHLLTGFSTGTTVLVGRFIGEKKKDEAGRAIAAGIELFAIMGLFLMCFTLIFARPITSLMNAQVEAFDKTVEYLSVCGSGFLFIAAYNLLGSIFRGLGDSKTPLISVAIAAALNIGGDIYFVKVLGLAAKGAAIATVMSQSISVIICFFIIRKRGLPFDFGKESFKGIKAHVKQTIKLGTPIAFQSIMVSLSFSVIVSIVNNISLAASAGIGVAEKVCAFIMLVPTAFSQALAAFVAQNMGAEKPKRAEKGLLYSMLASFAIGIFIAALTYFRGYWLTGIFTKDQEVIMASWEYLKAYAIDVLLTSWMFSFVGYFNGCGCTAFVMAQGVISAFGVRVPVSYLMSKQVPVSLFKIGLATPCSTMLQIIMCIVYYAYRHRKKIDS